MAQFAVGFRVHSGWASAVVVAGPANAPAVVDRRHIELADGRIPGSKQPYHAAEGLPLREAKTMIERCRKSTWLLARRGLEEIGRHRDVGCCGMLLAGGRPLPDLPNILASHALIHTAEGEFFRRAIADASHECRLAVRGIKEKELIEVSSRELDLTPAELRQRISDWGRELGPPWAQDEKFAALAAWLALAQDASSEGKAQHRPLHSCYKGEN